jgi:glycine cleavage system H lipoate-binding protein
MGAGWLFKIEVGDPSEVEELLDEGAYGKLAT